MAQGGRSPGILEAWGLGPSEVVALVGAGGKTTLLRALASAYEREAAVPVLTTTTQVWAPGPGDRPCVTAESEEELGKRVRAQLSREGGPLPRRGLWVGRGVDANGKLEGIPPSWARSLRDVPGVGAVLVEADGAARKPLKAPAPWEPVIPRGATTVVAMAGLDAQGALLDSEHVHRVEEVGRALGLDTGSRSPEGTGGRSGGEPDGRRVPSLQIPNILVCGYRRHVPSSARFLLFLNKADEYPVPPGLEQAVREGDVEVWCGSARVLGGGAEGAREESALRALRGPEARPVAVITAAGAATRMAGEKVLAPLGAGTVLGRVVRTVLRCSRVRRIIVVAGDDGGKTEKALRAELPGEDFRVVTNHHPELGLASSLQIGVAAAGGPGPVLVLLGDQPLVGVETLDAIMAAARGNPRAAAVGLAEEAEGGRGGGRVRPPVLLHRSLTPQLLELEGDQGARSILRRYCDQVIGVTGSAEEALDVDTPAQLETARALVEEGRG